MPIALPRDAPSWACLVLAVIACWLATRRGLTDLCSKRPRLVLLCLGSLAGVLSAGYLAFYLRGGPRIIDATSYWLEGRAMARGFLSFPVPEPSASFRGRFLVPAPESSALSVIFPPGYPALLALGFLVRAPLAIGPLLGAGLVIATYALAWQAFRDRKLALFAALLSTLCAALRYHSADTMSHGLAALLFALAPLPLLGPGSRRPLWIALSGLSLGWLLATRPVSGVVALALCGFLLVRSEKAKLPWLLLGMVPGVALLAAHQHAATGSWLGSTQLRYYGLADGPPGCFRYGFGQGIGCLHEHGGFVRENLPHGYGLLAALGTTGRRLWLHASDIANAWPLGLLVPVALVLGRKDARVGFLGAGCALLILGYAPFYFDGNYPGGGARMFAEALPFEHVLIAWLASRIALVRFVPAIALAGFAFHTSGYHRALRDREGGHPMFEPAVLEEANVRNGLVFVESDHGFNLGHVPGALDAKRHLVVARRHEDARDFALWNALGRPPTFLYRRRTDQPASISPFSVPRSELLQAEADWPPLAVSMGWADATHPSVGCLEGSGALVLHPDDAGRMELTLEVLGEPGLEVVPVARFAALAPGPVIVSMSLDRRQQGGSRTVSPGECWEVEGPALPAGSSIARLVLSTGPGPVALDRISLRRPASPGK
jgi:hypothetical protein